MWKPSIRNRNLLRMRLDMGLNFDRTETIVWQPWRDLTRKKLLETSLLEAPLPGWEMLWIASKTDLLIFSGTRGPRITVDVSQLRLKPEEGTETTVKLDDWQRNSTLRQDCWKGTFWRKIHLELLAEETDVVWKPVLLELLMADTVEQCRVLDGQGVS